MAELPLTEQQNPSTSDLDKLGTADLLHRINDEDRRVAWAVEREIDSIAVAVDAIAERLGAGGRLHYFGAGTSGRLGVLDASELPPTFSTASDLVVGHIAGGQRALTAAVEAAEDDERAGADEVVASNIGAADAVIGLSASGTTPYVLGALRAARRRGAIAIAVANTSGSPLCEAAQIAIVPLVGPEVLTGSSRLKAGTAQKLVLNMISTAVMVRLGKVYGNSMVDLQPVNAKLRARATRLVAQLSGSTELEAQAALIENGWRVKHAIVARVFGCSPDAAARRLAAVCGSLRKALERGAAGSTAK
ncbi:MAG TPA: N-acetylmuramic acid 6-phosphate etherase [Candidatus Eremiobacteraceae bacterium]|jgi:N-acetylmuramic acid 6-phosphate etherase